LAKKTEAARSKSSTEIVFEISAMDRPTIEVMKNALRQKAEQMIRTVQVSYGELEELSKECEDELKSLHCTDVTVDIGKPFCWLLLLLLLLLLMSRFK